MAREKTRGTITDKEIEIFCDYVRKYGSRKDAAEVIGIPYRTFTSYMSPGTRKGERFDRFRQKVAEAEEDYMSGHNSIEYQLAAKNGYRNTLFGPEETETVTEVVKDARGRVIQQKTVTKQRKKGVPRWAIERELGDSDVQRAIITLVRLRILSPEILQASNELIIEKYIEPLKRLVATYAINIEQDTSHSSQDEAFNVDQLDEDC